MLAVSIPPLEIVFISQYFIQKHLINYPLGFYSWKDITMAFYFSRKLCNHSIYFAIYASTYVSDV